MKRYMYNETQVKATAMFLHLFNGKLSSWALEQFENAIKDCIKRMHRDNEEYLSTVGFTIILSDEIDLYKEYEVLVDASLFGRFNYTDDKRFDMVIKEI